MDGVVAQAWLGAVEELGGAARPAAAAELEERYREPHRRYHTLAHVEAVLADCAWLADELAVRGAERAVVVLAACAHDVVYDAQPGADERASAQWARDRLRSAGVDDTAADRVSALVLATATHVAAPDDVGCGVLLDADLAILAADEEGYARYVSAVRTEYAAVPDHLWRSGRADVLRTLLDRAELYATEPARLRWDARARRNVTAELAALGD